VVAGIAPNFERVSQLIFPDDLGNDVDDNNRQGWRETIGLVPMRLLASRGTLAPRESVNDGICSSDVNAIMPNPATWPIMEVQWFEWGNARGVREMGCRDLFPVGP
jgi:hypothetical protein